MIEFRGTNPGGNRSCSRKSFLPRIGRLFFSRFFAPLVRRSAPFFRCRGCFGFGYRGQRGGFALPFGAARHRGGLAPCASLRSPCLSALLAVLPVTRRPARVSPFRRSARSLCSLAERRGRESPKPQTRRCGGAFLSALPPSVVAAAAPIRCGGVFPGLDYIMAFRTVKSETSAARS